MKDQLRYINFSYLMLDININVTYRLLTTDEEFLSKQRLL